MAHPTCHPTCYMPTDEATSTPGVPIHADGCPNEGGPILTTVMEDRYQVEFEPFPGVTTEYDSAGNELTWDGTAWVRFTTPIAGWLDCRFVPLGSDEAGEYFRCLTHPGDDEVTLGDQVSCGGAETAHRTDDVSDEQQAEERRQVFAGEGPVWEGLDDAPTYHDLDSAEPLRRPIDAPVPTPADSLGPVHIYEARCTRCGETFNPNDENDLEHLLRADETPCGGAGVMLGAYHETPDGPEFEVTATGVFTAADLFDAAEQFRQWIATAVCVTVTDATGQAYEVDPSQRTITAKEA